MNNITDLEDYRNKKNWWNVKKGLEINNPVLELDETDSKNKLKKLQKQYNTSIKLLQNFFWIQSPVNLIMSGPETWSKLTEARTSVTNLISDIAQETKKTNTRAMNIIWPENQELKKVA